MPVVPVLKNIKLPYKKTNIIEAMPKDAKCVGERCPISAVSTALKSGTDIFDMIFGIASFKICLFNVDQPLFRGFKRVIIYPLEVL